MVSSNFWGNILSDIQITNRIFQTYRKYDLATLINFGLHVYQCICTVVFDLKTFCECKGWHKLCTEVKLIFFLYVLSVKWRVLFLFRLAVKFLLRRLPANIGKFNKYFSILCPNTFPITSKGIPYKN